MLAIITVSQARRRRADVDRTGLVRSQILILSSSYRLLSYSPFSEGSIISMFAAVEEDSDSDSNSNSNSDSGIT